MTVSTYQDGSEPTLLDFFSHQPSAAEINSFRQQHPSWEYTYHLHPLRQALLNWFPFRPSAKLLEVGSGCGALTGLFCQQVKEVVALEPTSSRAQITQARHATAANLEIINRSLENYSSPKKFDYVTLIGVLEYAAQSQLDQPYLQLLQKSRHFLKKSGQLILAIENRLGLKYLAGCAEDHTGQFGSGLENYPYHPRLQTFSAAELIELLQAAGFASFEFYYPFPDYKLPQAVLDETQLQSLATNPLLFSELFADGWDPTTKASYFNPVVTSYFLAQNGLNPTLAPSFLIIAQP